MSEEYKINWKRAPRSALEKALDLENPGEAIYRTTSDTGYCACDDFVVLDDGTAKPCPHIIFTRFTAADITKMLGKPRKKSGKPAKQKDTAPSTKEEERAPPVVHKGGYYEVRGESIEDAWLVQRWANEAGISTEIVDKKQTSDYAYAHVRAVGNGVYTEDVVWHDFSTSREVILWDKVKALAKKGKKVEYDELGNPVLSPKDQADVIQRFVSFKNFAIRDAISKAARRAQLKALNKEWREEEEVEFEKEEVKRVAEKGAK